MPAQYGALLGSGTSLAWHPPCWEGLGELTGKGACGDLRNLGAFWRKLQRG